MNYAYMLETLERTSIIIDDVFAYSVAQEIIEHIEPRSVEKYQRRAYWPKWKEAMPIELESLTKKNVFG